MGPSTTLSIGPISVFCVRFRVSHRLRSCPECPVQPAAGPPPGCSLVRSSRRRPGPTLFACRTSPPWPVVRLVVSWFSLPVQSAWPVLDVSGSRSLLDFEEDPARYGVSPRVVYVIVQSSP